MGSLFDERIVKFSTQKKVYYFGRYGGLSRNGSFGDIPGHGASLTYRGLLVLWILKSNLVLSIRMSFIGHKKSIYFKSTVVRDANGQNGAIVGDIPG